MSGPTSERSAYFVLENLADRGVQTTSHFLAVYDPALDTGYIYATEGSPPQISPRGDGTYAINGESYAPDSLPLE